LIKGEGKKKSITPVEEEFEKKGKRGKLILSFPAVGKEKRERD